MTVVLDYGVNNLRSVQRAIETLGSECSVQNDLRGATKLILPGVGAFAKAMERLEPMADDIRQFASDGHPVLGICLGQQLLFESSEEFGSHEGLGLVPGRVVYFGKEINLKVPHIGWSPVDFFEGATLGSGINHGDRVYFVHSLYVKCANPSDVAATTTYGVRFAASIQRGNVYGTQFHPEKSGTVGLQILRNFLEC